MATSLTVDSVVSVAAGQMSTELAGEEVILNLETGTYYGLNEVGARIWTLLKEPCRVAEIRDTILAEYEVDRERCEADLFALLTRLADAHLIEVRHGSDAPPPARDAH